MEDMKKAIKDFLETLDYVTEGHESGGIIIREDNVEMYDDALKALTQFIYK